MLMFKVPFSSEMGTKKPAMAYIGQRSQGPAIFAVDEAEWKKLGQRIESLDKAISTMEGCDACRSRVRRMPFSQYSAKEWYDTTTATFEMKEVRYDPNVAALLKWCSNDKLLRDLATRADIMNKIIEAKKLECRCKDDKGGKAEADGEADGGKAGGSRRGSPRGRGGRGRGRGRGRGGKRGGKHDE